MRSQRLAALAIAIAANVGAVIGCGGAATLPPPPAYTPTASPEPETACPDQRAAAKRAREAALENATGTTREAVAAAVFANAECEGAQVDIAAIEARSQAAMIERIRAVRLLYQNARNLYSEVANYEVLRWNVGAHARLGALNQAFAGRLRGASAPAGIRDPAERASFLTELGGLARTYDARATAAYRAALDTAVLLPTLVNSDPAARAWVDSSCLALHRLGAVDASGAQAKLCPK